MQIVAKQSSDKYIFTDVCDGYEKIVETLNAIALENLAKAMIEVNGLLVHISTDYVFGG